MTQIVRVGEKEVGRLFPLAIEEGAEIGITLPVINFDKLEKTLKHCTENGAIFASTEGHRITGFVAILEVDSFWSDFKSLCTICYFVSKGDRNGAGRKLLKAAMDYAKGRQMELNLMVDTEERMETKDKMFKRMGFENRGGCYRMKG